MSKSHAQRIPGWKAVRQKWFARNPPDKDGNYECSICHQPVHKDKVSLDHIAPLELYPEYAKELSNLRPTNVFCNGERADSSLKRLRGRKVIGIKPHYRRKR